MTRKYYNFNAATPEIKARVDELLAKMTLEEKVGQTMQININEHNRAGQVERIRLGQAGSVLSIYGVENINAIQKAAVEDSPLGIPLLIGCDVIHGYRTIFPIPLAEACTW